MVSMFIVSPTAGVWNVFTQKDLNLCQIMWLELLKDYDKSVLY